MPWPPRQPSRAEISPEELADYELVVSRARDHLGLPDPEIDAGFRGRLLLSPQFAALQSEMGRVARLVSARSGSYSDADREFVDILLCHDFGTNVVGLKHFGDALACGVRIEAIRAIRGGREDLLGDDERQLARFARMVIGGRMDEPTWLAMERRMGERGTIEYAIFILHLQLTMRLMAVVGIKGPSDADVDAFIAGHDC